MTRCALTCIPSAAQLPAGIAATTVKSIVGAQLRSPRSARDELDVRRVGWRRCRPGVGGLPGKWLLGFDGKPSWVGLKQLRKGKRSKTKGSKFKALVNHF